MKRLVGLLLLVCAAANAACGVSVVRDELGRNVTVPDHPQRVICMTPGITDTIFALGAGPQVVAVTDYTVYPAEAREKPSVGGIINPSLEMIVSLKPDLVLAAAELNEAELVTRLERLNIPVFVVHPHGLAGVYATIESLGRAVHRESQASELVGRLKSRERAVREKVSGKRPPRLLFVVWPDPALSAGRGAFITELINIAGGKSVTDDLANEWPRVSFETLLERQPEYLLIVRGSHFDVQTLQRLSGWQQLDAVKQGKAFYADDKLNFPSPVVFDALEDLARQFHP